MTDPRLEAQLPHTLQGTDYSQLGDRYAGKVRDVYDQGDRLIIVTSDRVSAFDRILGTIPFKGEILTRMALAGFEAAQDILPSHVLDSPDPSVIVGKKCHAFPVEMVVRGYVTGSLWRDLKSGAADAYELSFPKNLRKDQQLDQPILTPATKAPKGEHDMPTSKAAIVASGAMTAEQLEAAEAAAFALFARGQALAAERGLILVDTKYELGLDADGQLTVIDEIHTPDSSRYWVAEGYAERFEAGEAQQMLDKENLRQWLLEEHGFDGHGEPPALSDEVRVMLADKYIRAFETVSGQPFEAEVGPVAARIEQNLRSKGYLPG